MAKTPSMKNASKFFFPSVLFLLLSCAEQNTNIARKVQARPKAMAHVTFEGNTGLLYKNELASLESPLELFLINPAEENTILGSKGTRITIPSNCLSHEDGSPVKSNVTFELKETLSKSDMVLNNVPTTANRSMLITGGAVYINARAGKENLKISCPEGIRISIPRKKSYSTMDLFSGNLDSKGNINWVKDSSLTPVDMGDGLNDEKNDDYKGGELISVEERMIMLANGDNEFNEEEPDSYLFTSGRFGWINCDRFYSDPREKAIVTVTTREIPEDYTTHMYVVFKYLNSIMPLYSQDNETFTSSDLPVGEEVYIVTLSGKAPKLFMDISSITIRKGTIETVSLKECTKEDVKTRLEYLN